MKSRWWTRAALAAALMSAAGAQAAPNHLTYTGELRAENGLPYTGSVMAMARLYSGASGGTAVWEQDLGELSVMGGVLQADLMGSGLMAALQGSSNLWLEFEIDGEILEPRQKLSSAPYAMVAGNAAMLGGMMPSAFITEDTIGNYLGAEALPTDGINQISNGSLKNQFMAVTRQFSGSPVPIPDFDPPTPGANALASFSANEGDGSYLTGLIVYTGFTLSALSNVTVRLFPPAATGVPPITLVSGQLSPAQSPFNNAWTVATTPELADILGKNITGTWTLTVTDNDDTLSGATPVGQLTSFSIAYDVVRANHLVVDGRLDVTGQANIGTLNATLGELKFQGSSFALTKAPRIVTTGLSGGWLKSGCSGMGGGIVRKLDVVLTKDSMVTFSATGIYQASSASSNIDLRLNGDAVDRLYFQAGSSWKSITHSWMGTLPAGTHTFDINITAANVDSCVGYGRLDALIFE